MSQEMPNRKLHRFSDISAINFPPILPPHRHKDWHLKSSFGGDLFRTCVAVSLLKDSFPELIAPDTLLDQEKTRALLKYVRKIEVKSFEAANNREEYSIIARDKMAKYLLKNPEAKEIFAKSKTKAEIIMERNARFIEEIEDKKAKKKVEAELRCKLCLDGIKLYCCLQCWNAFCKKCHDNMKKFNVAEKCHYCQHENPNYEFVILPRF